MNIFTAENIKQLRMDAGLTQQDFADAIGVTRELLNKMEAGKKSISKATQILLSNYVNDPKVNKGTNGHLAGDSKPLPQSGQLITVGENEMEDLGNGLFRLKTLLVDQKSAAGYLTGWGDQEYLGELKEHTVTMRNPVRGVYRSFQINDNNESMYNPQDARSIAPRDIVTGRLLKREHWRDKLHFKRYPFWVIVHRIEGITTKEIVDHNVQSGIIVCHSLNPSFEDFSLFLDDVIQLFNVIKVEHDYQ